MAKLISNPIFISALVGFVAFALLGCFGRGAERPSDAITVMICAIILGTVGAVVGGLIGLPLYLGFKRGSEQDRLEQRYGLKIRSEKPIKRFLGTIGVALGIGLLTGSLIGFPEWMNFPTGAGLGLAALFIYAGRTWLKNETYGN